MYNAFKKHVVDVLYQKSNLYLFCSASCCWYQSVISLNGDKLVHVQKWDGKQTVFVREIKDGKMIVVSNAFFSLPPFFLTLFQLFCHNLVSIGRSFKHLQNRGNEMILVNCFFSPASLISPKEENAT